MRTPRFAEAGRWFAITGPKIDWNSRSSPTVLRRWKRVVIVCRHAHRLHTMRKSPRSNTSGSDSSPLSKVIWTNFLGKENPQRSNLQFTRKLKINISVGSVYRWWHLDVKVQNDVLIHFYVRSMHLTRTAIFFKNADVISLKRSELYGPTEFLAHCGGLLGLFMGVSLLSIVEAIYYATLRLGCTLRTRWTAADRNRVSE